MASAPTIHVLSGCTGVGKTEWALRWAEANDGEIVSCDSLLFYRGMDIGTAKPSPGERARVPHHLIDVVDISDHFNVVMYADAALDAVRNIMSRGKRVLVAGGSGFYLKAFFGPVADEVPVSPELRAEIRARLETEGLQALVDELAGLNSSGMGGLDIRNPRRVVRALERCIASGRSLAELLSEFKDRPGMFAGFDVRLTELVRDPADLASRLEQRISAMFSEGLVEEVRRLAGEGIRSNPSASKAIGYREVLAHLDGALSAEYLAAEVLKNTKALARKQRTWFRTQLPPHRTVDAAGIGSESELFAADQP